MKCLKRRGWLPREEIESGRPAPESQKAPPPLPAPGVPAMAARRGSYMRPQADAQARFQAGDHVRARKINPEGHTRLPRYARGREGTIARHHGIFVFPDTNAHFMGENPQHLYSVRFAARELWGDGASPPDSVCMDIRHGYLAHT